MIKLSILFFSLITGFVWMKAMAEFPEHLKSTAIAKLKEGDSLILYQCNVVPLKEQELVLASGQKMKMKAKDQFVSLTEKIKIQLVNSAYVFKHYSSPTTYYPNKKFAYLKMVEKPYWEFKLDKDTIMPFSDALLIAAYEKKCLAINEYDFKVNESNSPQLIVNGKKISEQYRLKEQLILSNVLSVMKK
jgi:hypothetical protein